MTVPKVVGMAGATWLRRSAMTQFGDRTQNPDLIPLIVDAVNEAVPPQLHVEAANVVIRAQKTVEHVDDPRLGYVRSESACLAVLSKAAMTDALLVFLAAQDRSGTWRMASFQLQPLGEPPLKPFVGGVVRGPGRLVVGALTNSADVGGIRARFSDGSTMSESVIASACLLFAPLTNPATWTRPTVVEIFDKGGKQLVSENHDVDPNRRPS
jgi:hypothetical protein